jgi:hypothetical protein
MRHHGGRALIPTSVGRIGVGNLDQAVSGLSRPRRQHSENQTRSYGGHNASCFHFKTFLLLTNREFVAKSVLDDFTPITYAPAFEVSVDGRLNLL